MTDSIKRVSGAQATSEGGGYGATHSEHHKNKGAAAPQNDLIEISQDARDRSKGKTKKGLLEYLKELLG